MYNDPCSFTIGARVTFSLAGRVRSATVEALRHYDEAPESRQAAIQPAAGGPRIWLDVDLLTPVQGSPHAQEVIDFDVAA
jgi:hypothetical protein